MISSAYIVQYTVVCILLYIIIWFTVIKIMFPFWNLQPVLHPYDIIRHLMLACGIEPFVIWSHAGLYSLKYVDLTRVKTVAYDALTQEDIHDTLTLLRRKYIDSPDVLFCIDEHTFASLLSVGHPFPCFVSVPLLQGGCCVSYPIVIARRDRPVIEAYYMDLFTVDTLDPRVLFQTHEYIQRRENPCHGGHITLFKKEVEGYLGITPCLSSYTYMYPIIQSRFHSLKGAQLVPDTVNISFLHPKGGNIHLLMEFMTHPPCDVVSVGFPTLLHWIETKYWYVFAMTHTDRLLALYFFRDTRFQYESYSSDDAHTRSIELVNSYTTLSLSYGTEHLFFLGFFHAVRELTTRINLDYRLIHIPDISRGNRAILQRWNIHNTPVLRTYISYSFFNYCWKCDPQSVLILLS